MIPMSPAYVLYYIPVVLAASLVLAGTRYEVPRLIWRQTGYYVVWITVFMLIVAALLQLAIWLI